MSQKNVQFKNLACLPKVPFLPKSTTQMPEMTGVDPVEWNPLSRMAIWGPQRGPQGSWVARIGKIWILGDR